nr:type II toxin-antitoxin system VapC family toxin [Mesorhizobium sp. LNHC220B00]
MNRLVRDNRLHRRDHAAVAPASLSALRQGAAPAALTFGDCIAYATARLEAVPLLFTGEDFRLTDTEAAI